MINQDQDQSLGKLRIQKIPLSKKVLMKRKSSFVIKLSVLVLVFFVVMVRSIPDLDFWKLLQLLPFIIFVELCVLAQPAISIWWYERWKFKFSLYDNGIVVDAKGIEHIAKYEDVKIAKITRLVSQQRGGLGLGWPEYTLQMPDGFTKTLLPMSCEDYGAYQEMFECALDLSYQVILPQAREKLNAGESLEFGLFHLSGDGIQCGEKKFLWTDGYFVEFKYDLGEFSTGTFKLDRENAGMFANQPRQHYAGVNHPLVFIDLLKSMNKLAEDNILH
jgi:hypothetical protein